MGDLEQLIVDMKESLEREIRGLRADINTRGSIRKVRASNRQAGSPDWKARAANFFFPLR